MEHIGSFEAKTHFSELLARVKSGEEFVVTIRGEPVARLTQHGGDRDIVDQIERCRKLRDEISEHGAVLLPGESLKELGRTGLKW